MNFQRQVSRMLDEEHRSSLQLLARVEQALGRANEADWPALARQLEHHLEQEVGRHFAFEEGELFPRLSETGDSPMAALLAGEHDSIREVAAELLPPLRSGSAAQALKPLLLELIERQVSHVQKETMALLPLLDDLLDDETDRALAMAYASV